MTRVRVASWSLAIALVGAASMAHAQVAADAPPVTRSISRPWLSEPTPSETVRVALRYFRVHPEALDGMRSAARARALMPILSGSYQFADWRFASQAQTQITSPNMTTQVWNQQNNTPAVGVTWDLRELVFNPAEVAVYGLVGVQRDMMLEVTRTYFARRQLLVRIAYQPPSDPVALEALDLRVQEFTALLDVLTGGWFSQTVENRRR